MRCFLDRALRTARPSSLQTFISAIAPCLLNNFYATNQDGGNIINIGSSSPITYRDGCSTGVVGSDTYTMDIVTHGISVLTIQNLAADTFGISGNTGADGYGSMKTGSIALCEGHWHAYWKQLWNSGDPSITHILITTASSATHSFSTDTDSDFDQLTGLAGHALIYLMWGESGSAEVSDQLFIEVIEAATGGYACTATPSAEPSSGPTMSALPTLSTVPSASPTSTLQPTVLVACSRISSDVNSVSGLNFWTISGFYSGYQSIYDGGDDVSSSNQACNFSIMAISAPIAMWAAGLHGTITFIAPNFHVCHCSMSAEHLSCNESRCTTVATI